MGYTDRMNLAERLISVAAPYRCLSCELEGTLLCTFCSNKHFGTLHKAQWPSASLAVVGWCSSYDGYAKELMQRLKFERAKIAHEHIADALAGLPLLTEEPCLVVPIVTVPSRVRQRGYDQSVLIARAYARKRRLPFCNSLLRVTKQRQLGAHRAQRLQQMEQAFVVRNRRRITNCNILLIDDVMTTGATLESAAKVLLEAGARSVSGLVFARA